MSKLIYTGKTKDVYENSNGTYTLTLKDDATGKDGVFDPGENAVGLSIKGLGRESLKLTQHYFGLIADAGIPHHLIVADLDAVSMEVKPAKLFGKGLEFVCRVVADGSFVKRYGDYVQPGDNLDYFVEVTLKNDDRQDPPITKEALILLGIMTAEAYDTCVALTKSVAKLIHNDMQAKGVALHDIKFEFGLGTDDVMLIDEISGGCMRVYKDGQNVNPMDIGQYVL